MFASDYFVILNFFKKHMRTWMNSMQDEQDDRIVILQSINFILVH